MSNFKVIIAGAGPTGLAAAHCLSKAGIDFEILERRKNIEDNVGASAALWPNTARVFSQLGLLDEALKSYFPVKWKANLIRDGTVLGKSDVMIMPEVYHGYPWMLFSRPGLISLLKRTLPTSALPKIHLSKAITAIGTTATGVTVHCADGTSHSGSIVLGCDGVNSTVRRLLDEKHHHHSQLLQPTTTTPVVPYQLSAFQSRTIGIYGFCRGRIPGVEPETWYETHGDRFTSQLSGGDDQTLFLLYERLPEAVDSLGSQKQRFGDEDKQKFIEKWGDCHVTPTVTLRELMGQAEWSLMSHLEEGVVERWYGDRIVLAGDAVAKMTPNSGFGINTGVQSVVAITNALRRVVKEAEGRGQEEVGGEALLGAFKEYEAVRRANVEKTVRVSGMHTRIATWDSWLLRFVDRWVVPLTNGYLSMRRLVGPVVQEGLVLDFVEETGYKEGGLKWTVPRVGPVAEVVEEGKVQVNGEKEAATTSVYTVGDGM